MASNVDTAREMYEAFGAGDMDRLGRLIASDADWASSDELPAGGDIKGRDAIMENFGVLASTWNEFSVEPGEFIDGGEWVTVRGTQKASGAGGSFECPYAHLLKFADGVLAHAEFFTDSAKAKAALG